jgi:hypothetical protein
MKIEMRRNIDGGIHITLPMYYDSSKIANSIMVYNIRKQKKADPAPSCRLSFVEQFSTGRRSPSSRAASVTFSCRRLELSKFKVKLQ